MDLETDMLIMSVCVSSPTLHAIAELDTQPRLPLHRLIEEQFESTFKLYDCKHALSCCDCA